MQVHQEMTFLSLTHFFLPIACAQMIQKAVEAWIKCNQIP
jgi:hypothetical protein